LGAQVETLARTVLQAPVEIQVGGRSIVNADITQLVELREEDDRFLRLLEVLPSHTPCPPAICCKLMTV
jgi:ATP-dependent RNA helicase DDX46/PRP5